VGNVRIVTDSASDLPPELVERHGITVVPLTVRFGSDEYKEGVELSTEEFWRKLRSSAEAPSTAAPSAGDFQAAYQKLVDEGADGIVSIHLSASLSATHQAATVAAKECAVAVEVVDSLAVTGATGLQTLRAVEAAQRGASPAEIAKDIESVRERTHLYGVIDTLEYLRRGGRIGGAQALLGTMLKVKPVISLQHGVVEPVGRVRTRGKALEHLVGLVRTHQSAIERIKVIHGEAPDLDQFLSMLDKVIDVSNEDVWTLGPVVGTHAGPGVVGVVFITRG
jgi:DegV family protein with EDD domain